MVAKTKYVGMRAAAAGALVAVGLLTLMMLVVEVRPAEATFPGQNGRIAFVSNGVSIEENPEFNLEIFTMRPDGTHRRMVTHTAASRVQHHDTAWSPDGTKIAFASNRGGFSHGWDRDIFIMTLSGTRVITRLTENSVDDMQPAWSPDGSKIVFRSGTNIFSTDIYVMNADGTNQTRLTDNPGMDTDPAWSPDGTKIAFTSDRSGAAGGGSVHVMNADGTNPQDIGRSGPPYLQSGLSGSPNWSPNGSKIAFVSGYPRPDSGIYNGVCIYKMNPDGSGKTPLTTHEPPQQGESTVSDAEPAWSPSGTKITFSRSGGGLGGWEVFKMNADGTHQIRLTYNALAPWGSGHPPNPDWGPKQQ